MNEKYQNLRDYLTKTETTAIDLYRSFKKECAKKCIRPVQPTTFYMWCRMDSYASKQEHKQILADLTGMNPEELFVETA